ncbi:hypothetical protein [Roseomonas populi]|uniref:Tip attachment protein J domain-containing protein n=1 Tax=Roseomonas populi TaxID=3121582 RepID=A0ABT1X108_9PROT|nr:hypothetical protein [Roseomonas pecuniae]MCR0981786.1 hypothetical protein [Roseomonas pecuniae]
MSLGLSPLAAAPLAALWQPDIPDPVPGTVLVGTGAVDPIWAVALERPAGLALVVPLGLTAGLPAAAFAFPAVAEPALPVLRYTDRGWIGEPTDPNAPNESWPARMLDAPSIVRTIPIYPTEARRSEVNAGEILLANADGALDSLATDWRLAGRRLTVLRGPYRRGRRAARSEFSTIGGFRIERVAQGTDRLRLPLGSAAADLTMPASGTYAGTGSWEGTAEMAGQAKPIRYGIHRNVRPAIVVPGLLAAHLHDGPISAVLAVRGRGDPFGYAGDYPNLAALAAATVAAGTYVTCLAAGWLRLGSTTSSLTVDLRGAAPAGAYLGTAAAIAADLLGRRGGVTSDLAQAVSFYDWPVGEVRLDASGLTVAAAMDALASSVGGWWGADALGRFRGSQLLPPEIVGPSILLEPWMLATPPEEVDAAQAPWWRVRVDYRALGVTQSGEDLGAVSDADRALYGQAAQTATEYRPAVQSAFPGAQDGPQVPSAFDDAADAQAMAVRLMDLHGTPRRTWRAEVRPDQAWRFWSVMEPGQPVSLTWSGIAALRGGRTMILRGISARGDRLTLDLWG